jgi:hypothetical protein
MLGELAACMVSPDVGGRDNLLSVPDGPDTSCCVRLHGSAAGLVLSDPF